MLSLRNRIVLLTTMTLLVILSILYVAVNFMFSASLVNTVDNQLQAGAEQLKRKLRLDEPDRLDLYTVPDTQGYSRSSDNLNYIVWDADKRRPLRRSSSLLRVETPFPDFNQKLSVMMNNLEFAGKDYRVYNEVFASESPQSGRSLVLQLLHPLDDVHTEVSRLNTLFFWMTPLPILLVVMGGWWVAGRALQPVRNFIEELNSINADQLSTRIQVTRKDELGELALAFNFLLNRIEATFQSLKRFTADAAHQLRTPLTSIRALSEVALSRERSKTDYQDAFGNVLEEVDHLLELSDSLMQLARADAGIVDMKASPENVTALLNNWIENLMPLAEEKNIHIETRIQNEVSMYCYPVLLEAIIVNLLANAINYTPRDGRIHITLRSEGSELQMKVCDSGPGVPDEDKERIFDRFVRLERTRQTVYGSGLGLAIVRAAINAHQGTVSVSDNTPIGSCFSVSLPYLKKNSG